MSIRYALYKNEKIAGKDHLVARVHTIGTLDKEEMLERMVRSGTTLTRTDLLGAWELIEETGRTALLDGWGISLPLCHARLSIRGVFEEYDDRFDPHRHKVVAQFQSDGDLRRAIYRDARPARMHAEELRPLLLAYYDVFTGQRDQVLTPGGIGRLYGNRLRFDPDDPRQGLFVLGADGGVVRVKQVAENRSRKLIFLVPPLPAGAYKLAVRAAYSGEKDLDVGFLDGVLQVGSPEALPEGPARPFPLLRLPE